MKVSHGPRSPRWRGNPRQYQVEAQAVFAIHHDRGVLPWSWITTNCDVDQCLDPICMTVRAAKRIAYPEGVCIYCGDPAGSLDHLLPRPVTGDALRHMVACVPSCGNCNSRIGDEPSSNIGVRRRRAQLSIERGGRKLLLRPIKSEDEMASLGPMLRAVAVTNNAKTVRLLLRLGWPSDPFYDIRAFQKSGIPDPVALEMCDAHASPLRPEYAIERESA